MENHCPGRETSRKAWGFLLGNFDTKSWISATLLATAMTMASLLALRFVFPFRIEAGLASRFFTYLLWAALQQMLICRLVIDRIAKDWLAVIVGSSVFALVHLPNFTLMTLTALFGIVFYPLYRRYGLLLPIVVAHAVIGTYLDKFTEQSLRVLGL